MMRRVVLYRDQGSPNEDADERAAIKRHFGFGKSPLTSRMDIAHGDLVIGRYSVLPFYRELEADILRVGGRLINSATQHEYVADLRNWYADLRELTPKTWFRLQDVDRDGPFVLKGSTNSRKHDWATHMFAPDRRAAGEVYSRLAADGLVGRQEIVIREYVPLVTYGHLIGGLPITKEFRFFIAPRGYGRTTVLASPFYWSSFLEDAGLAHPPEPSKEMGDLVREVQKRVGGYCAFYTVDVAERLDGTPVVIELNDGQMAGLSGADPDQFYDRLSNATESFCRSLP